MRPRPRSVNSGSRSGREKWEQGHVKVGQSQGQGIVGQGFVGGKVREKSESRSHVRHT